MRGGLGPREISQLISALEKPDDILAFYRAALSRNALLSRLDDALGRRRFEDENGNSELLDKANVTQAQVALIHFLATSLKSPVTVETGFGLGVSALAFLASGAEYDHRRHLSIDPYGLQGRGEVIRNYIDQLPGKRFALIKEASQYALPRLVSQGELGDCHLSLIDGSHLFEIVMSDFTHLDAATPAGGCIIVDDAAFPAIETVVNFVRTNKRNYRVFSPCDNTAVLVKLTVPDGRKWYHFRPFEVSNRANWTRARDAAMAG